MGDLLYETVSPLNWSDEGEPQELPESAIAFRVRKFTGKPGRPPVVWKRGGPLHVGLDTTMEEFCKYVNDEPGSYRLYPVDRFGHELEPVAVVEVVPDENTERRAPVVSQELAVIDDDSIGPIGPGGVPRRMVAELPHRFFDVYERMITSRDAHDELLSKVLTTLVTTTASIQQSTAALLNAATTTVRVANGVEALDRVEAPQLDIDTLTDKVAGLGQLKESLAALGDGSKSDPPWFVQLLNGPVGMGLMSVANHFAQHIAEAQKAAIQQAAQQQAAQQAAEAEPQQQAPAAPPTQTAHDTSDAGNGADNDEDPNENPENPED